MRADAHTAELPTAAALATFCDDLLVAGSFSDYCPNGLQVDGTRPVARLVSGVTASLALIEAAIAADADALLVHHGLFWKGDDARLTGIKGRRVRALMGSGLALLAWHLPLDVHPLLGNNARLAAVLGIEDATPTGSDGLVWRGRLPAPLAPAALVELVAHRLGRVPLHVPAGNRPVATLAWCTGAAQGYLERAAALGVDAYLSGEVSEQTVHQAREHGLDYLACGHHATERYGVQALGKAIAARFGCEHRFIEIDNPV